MHRAASQAQAPGPRHPRQGVGDRGRRRGARRCGFQGRPDREDGRSRGDGMPRAEAPQGGVLMAEAPEDRAGTQHPGGIKPVEAALGQCPGDHRGQGDHQQGGRRRPSSDWRPGPARPALVRRSSRTTEAARQHDQAQRDAVERQPTGLRMEPADGDRLPAPVTQDDQGGDPQHVEGPAQDRSQRDQQERLREAQFAAEPPETDPQEHPDQADPLVAGALGGDLHLESLGPQHELLGEADDIAGEQAQYAADRPEGRTVEQSPQRGRPLSHHQAGDAREAGEEQRLPLRTDQPLPIDPAAGRPASRGEASRAPPPSTARPRATAESSARSPRRSSR